MRIATVADAMPVRCVFATGSALASVHATPFSPRRLVSDIGAAG